MTTSRSESSSTHHVQQATMALSALRDSLTALSMPYVLQGTAAASYKATLIRDQLGDYVLPRLASLDAPLLAVVGGSTGAGKSTLVSSLVRRHVARASAIRPTTRRPLLLHAPTDAAWFDTDRVLGSLSRMRVDADAPASPATDHTPRELELRACEGLPEGLAIVDAPDVDSVVEDNRDLAATLLAGADLWIFVTTAARYADAVPWEHLRAAAERHITAAIVLDRVPQGAQIEVEADLRRRLAQAHLAEAPVFTIPETALDDDGFLPESCVSPLRQWLGALASDAAARQDVAHRSLTGAIGSLLAQSELLAVELASQEAEHAELRRAATSEHDDALERVIEATEDGSMLHGEVLARWQEFVGTGDLFRSLEVQVGRVRDRVTSLLRGRPAPAKRVEQAIGSSLVELLVAESQRACLATERSWRRAGTSQQALNRALAEVPSQTGLEVVAAALVHDWQRQVLTLVRSEGSDKRLTARLLSLGVNGAGVVLMILVFAHTGGLTGGEVGIAGGTAILAQRVLEAVFGDQAMRGMTKRAREDLSERATALFANQAKCFTDALPLPTPSADTLREQLRACQEAATSLRVLPAARGRRTAGRRAR